MTWNTVDWFFLGLLIGYILNPFFITLKAIIMNALVKNNCTGDCNQGRTCTCKEKKDGIS